MKTYTIMILVVSLFLPVGVVEFSQSKETQSSSLDFGRADKPVANEVIWVDADSDLGEFTLLSGFLHGRDENSPAPNESLVAALSPKDWRLYKAQSYALAQIHQSNITYGLSDHYAWSQGGFPYAEPWTDWDYYEAFMLYVLQYYDDLFPDYPVEYYDIWNEPDHPYFWHGTYVQLLETFARCYNVVKSYNPEAKVVGPSISWFRPGNEGVEGIVEFLVDLDTLYGIRLDAIAWHENGGAMHGGPSPKDIPYRTQYLRSQIQANFPPDYTPELHVNEFMGKQEHLSPGWNVGYLYYLDQAGVDKVMRSCWWVYTVDPYDYWCDCWNGMNGMLMKDGETPQLAYWVWLAYARMKGGSKLYEVSSELTTNVIATRNDSSNTLKLLIGRYLKTAPEDVTIYLVDYPYIPQNVWVKVELVPNYAEFYTDPPMAIPFPGGPLPVFQKAFPVIDGNIQFTLENFEDGDAYLVTVSFIYGDANGDGEVTISDAIYCINYLFKNGPAPEPIQISDSDCDGEVNITDAVYLINYLFKSGPSPRC